MLVFTRVSYRLSSVTIGTSRALSAPASAPPARRRHYQTVLQPPSTTKDMAKTCLACKDIINIKKDTPLDCTSCKNSYHIQCVGVPVEKNTKVLQSTWTCPSCAIKPPRGDNSNTPVQFPQSDKITLRSKLREARASASSANSPCNQCVTQDELISTSRNEIREAMRDDLTDIINTCLKGQLKQLREEINDVKDSISFTNAMFEEFKSDVISAKSTMFICLYSLSRFY